MGNLFHRVQNLLVALLRLHPLFGIAAAPGGTEQFFKNILQIQFTAPAKILRKRQGHTVAVIYLGEQIGIQRAFDMAAQHFGKGIAGQHGSLAGTAAGDHIVRRAAVQQDGPQDAALDVGELGLVVRGVHAVVVYGVAHGLHHFFQGRQDGAVLGRLAVLVDERDLHIIILLL